MSTPLQREETVGPEEIRKDFLRAGYSYVDFLHGDTYRDRSTVLVCPTRGGKPKDYRRPDGEPAAAEPLLPARVLFSMSMLSKPTNHRFAARMITGDEVGVAYNRAIAEILAHKELANFSYILTHEDDNLMPASGLICLIEAIERSGFDAVAGVYHMKGPTATPMAFGRPGVTDGGGGMDFSPRDLTEGHLAANRIENGCPEPGDLDASLVEVNGVACGATLWRLGLFRELPPPWFTTFTRFSSGSLTESMTQDLAFCRKAREAGKRFAVDCRVKVGHLDVETGIVY